MKSILVLSFILIFFTSCNRSSISETSNTPETEQKVLVITDESKCKTAWGETLMSGESRKAYKLAETSSCQQTCEEISETITCKDGKLSQSNVYIFPTCIRPKCDCKLDFLPNAPTLKHGDFVKLYTTQSVECKSCSQYEVQRQCIDGTLIGDSNAKFQSCDSVACKDCPVNSGYFLKHEESKIFYKTTKGQNCDSQKKCESSAISQTRTCTNGILSGDSSFNQLTCENEMCSCTVQSSTYKHNDTVTYFTKSESKCSDNYACSDAGIRVTSKCIDGKIEGLSTEMQIFNSCQPELCKCIYKDAMGVETTLNDGQKLDVFTQSAVACGESCTTVKGSIVCNRGKLTGNTNYGATSCSSNSCGCRIGDVRIDNNKTQEVFQNANPACGTKCDAIKGLVTCKNGVLTGNTELTATSCVEQTCDCSYQNVSSQKVTVLTGTSASVWQKPLASCGETCNSLKGSVSCLNTVLTGDTTYKSDTCTQQKCECETPWKTKVLAAETFEAASKYKFFKMDKSICGQLKCSQNSDLFKYFACVRQGTTTVWMDEQKNVVSEFPVYKFDWCYDPTCSCTVAGQSINEGSVRGFYKKDKVACGQSCESGDNYVSISCNSDLTTTVTPRNVNLESFFNSTPAPTTTCKPDDCPPGAVVGSPGGGGNGTGQYGDGGGTGGGVGDGTGVGIGFGGRSRTGGGGGNGSNSMITIYTWQKLTSREPCTLPWGGKISHGASVIAFKKSVAESGKKCGFYRVNRVCLEGSLTGDPQAIHLRCEEPQ